MSDADRRGRRSQRYDGVWMRAVAQSRGVALSGGEAQELAEKVSPTLEAFARIAIDLCADDDIYEFRRLLQQEAPGA